MKLKLWYSGPEHYGLELEWPEQRAMSIEAQRNMCSCLVEIVCVLSSGDTTHMENIQAEIEGLIGNGRVAGEDG